MTKHFIRERLYLNGASPKTVKWYHGCFQAFAGALVDKHTVIDRIARLKEKGTSNISIQLLPALRQRVFPLASY